VTRFSGCFFFAVVAFVVAFAAVVVVAVSCFSHPSLLFRICANGGNPSKRLFDEKHSKQGFPNFRGQPWVSLVIFKGRSGM